MLLENIADSLAQNMVVINLHFMKHTHIYTHPPIVSVKHDKVKHSKMLLLLLLLLLCRFSRVRLCAWFPQLHHFYFPSRNWQIGDGKRNIPTNQ